jgi:predicted metalloendopeptidase
MILCAGWIKVGLVQELQLYWDCLLRHYSSYFVPELGPYSRVNGLRTRSENLADHIGLAAAYWAFNNLLQSPEQRYNSDAHHKQLVGLETFSQSQLFFLSFSHVR